MGGRPFHPLSSRLLPPGVPPGRPQKLTSGGGVPLALWPGGSPPLSMSPERQRGRQGPGHPERLARDPGCRSGHTGRCWPLNQVGTPSSGPRPSRHGVKPGWAKMPATPFAGWQGCFSPCLWGLLGGPFQVRVADRLATRCLKFGLPWPPSQQRSREMRYQAATGEG